MHVQAHPQDPDTLWIMNVQFWKSIDGGRTFFNLPTPHADNHDLWIDPLNPQRVIESNDGGANVSFNGGDSWSSSYNQPTMEFYHVTTDTQIPYRIYGAQQDNTTICLPSRWPLAGIPNWTGMILEEARVATSLCGPMIRTSSMQETIKDSLPAMTTGRASHATSPSGPKWQRVGARKTRSTASNGRHRSCFHLTIRTSSISPETMCSARRTRAIAGR